MKAFTENFGVSQHSGDSQRLLSYQLEAPIFVKGVKCEIFVVTRAQRSIESCGHVFF